MVGFAILIWINVAGRTVIGIIKWQRRLSSIRPLVTPLALIVNLAMLFKPRKNAGTSIAEVAFVAGLSQLFVASGRYPVEIGFSAVQHRGPRARARH